MNKDDWILVLLYLEVFFNYSLFILWNLSLYEIWGLDWVLCVFKS